MNSMSLDGYQAVATFDKDATTFHGQVVNTRDVLTFQGQSLDELRNPFRETLDDYVAWCAERGKEPERPYSGAVSVELGSNQACGRGGRAQWHDARCVHPGSGRTGRWRLTSMPCTAARRDPA